MNISKERWVVTEITHEVEVLRWFFLDFIETINPQDFVGKNRVEIINNIKPQFARFYEYINQKAALNNRTILDTAILHQFAPEILLLEIANLIEQECIKKTTGIARSIRLYINERFLWVLEWVYSTPNPPQFPEYKI